MVRLDYSQLLIIGSKSLTQKTPIQGLGPFGAFLTKASDLDEGMDLKSRPSRSPKISNGSHLLSQTVNPKP